MTLGAGETVIVDVYPHVYGGAQAVAHQLAVELAALGRPVAFVTTGPGPVPARVADDGIAVHELAPPAALGYYGRTTTGWRKSAAFAALPRWWRHTARALRGVSVLHVDDHRGMLLFAPAARLARVPVVWHVHSVHPSNMLNRGLAALAARIVVPSAAVLDRLPGIDRRKVAVVANPLPAAATAIGVARSRSPRAVTAARLHPDKGVDVLLEAAAVLRATVPDVVIDVYGEAQAGWEAYASSLRDRHAALGLDGTVRFLGYCEAPARRWLDAALYVQPARSTTEVQPLAVLEAMAVGLPVVASAVGGIPEMVVDDREGLLVPEGDPAALAAAMESVLTDPELAGRFGAAGRARALAWPSPAAMAAVVASIHDELRRPTRSDRG